MKTKNTVFTDTHQDDLRVIKAIKAGDANAFAEIVAKYETHLYQKIYLAVRSKANADDILQDIYLHVYLNVGSYKKIYTFNAWLTRVANNVMIDWIRKRNSNLVLKNQVSMDAPILSPAGGSDIRFELEDKSAAPEVEEYELEHSKHFDAIHDLMTNHLSKKDQIILDLYFLKKKRQREISALLNMKYGTVRVRVLRIKEKLQKLAIENRLPVNLEECKFLDDVNRVDKVCNETAVIRKA